MLKPVTDRRRPGRDIMALCGFLFLCLAVSGIGGAITATSVGAWYQTLVKPPFNPPDWVFAPVWTVLYCLMAVAAWRVWRRPDHGRTERALAVFVLQLVLNLLWSFLFFGLQRIGLALVEIGFLLLVLVVNTHLFWRVDRWAGLLFVPYVAWVAFASLLNGAIWWLNRV
jgi:tryptophan-rich sensory protein